MRRSLFAVLILSIVPIASAETDISFTFGQTQLQPGQYTTISVNLVDSGGLRQGNFLLGINKNSPGAGLLDIDGNYIEPQYGDTSSSCSWMSTIFNDIDSFGIRSPCVMTNLNLFITPGLPDPSWVNIKHIGFTASNTITGPVTFDFINWGTGQTLGSASINIVPEPVTIAFLGLGALALRRRK